MAIEIVDLPIKNGDPCFIPTNPWTNLRQVLSPEGDGISVACSEVILPSATGQLGASAPAVASRSVAGEVATEWACLNGKIRGKFVEKIGK